MKEREGGVRQHETRKRWSPKFSNLVARLLAAIWYNARQHIL